MNLLRRLTEILVIAIFTIFIVSTVKADDGMTLYENESATNPAIEEETTSVLNGFVSLEDGRKRYYINNVYITGFKKINKKKYYFDSNGIMKTGHIKIKKDYYYFDNNGIMKNGLIKIKGKVFYFNKNGKAVKKGWIKCSDKKKRYGVGKGEVATGLKKIGKKIYFFNTKKATVKEKGFIKYKNAEYYCKGAGKLAKGYQALRRKGKLNGYYFSKKTGKMVKNKTIGYLRIPKDGKLPLAYALGIRKLNSHGWNLYRAYSYSRSLAYYGQLYRTSSSEAYSLRGFLEGHGNCYVMAATFYIQAKLLGYNAHQISGYVGSAPHSWVVIRHRGGYSVYDPDFSHETGRNGWRIYYGKPGTWRYNSYRFMN